MKERHSGGRADSQFSGRAERSAPRFQRSSRLAAWARSFAIFGLFLVVVAPLLEELGIRVLSTYYWLLMWIAGSILTKMGTSRSDSSARESAASEAGANGTATESPMDLSSGEQALSQLDSDGAMEPPPGLDQETVQLHPQDEPMPDSPTSTDEKLGDMPTEDRMISADQPPIDLNEASSTPSQGSMGISEAGSGALPPPSARSLFIGKVLAISPILSIIIVIISGIVLFAASLSYQEREIVQSPPPTPSVKVQPSPPQPPPAEAQHPSQSLPQPTQKYRFSRSLPDCRSIASSLYGMTGRQTSRSSLPRPQQTWFGPYADFAYCYDCQNSDGSPGTVIFGGTGTRERDECWPRVVRTRRNCNCSNVNMQDWQ